MRDSRSRPQIPTRAILRAVIVMFLSRLGSLRALAQTRPSGFWHSWLGGALPSADSIGRVGALMEVEELRIIGHHVYTRLKRMKALEPPPHGLMVAAVDGHEMTASRKRCCPECCQRTIHTRDGDVVEYYHRYSVLRLVGGELSVMLDAEPIRPGEDELASARRLVERALEMYPRAFDVVVGDGLYANTDWFRFLRSHGKDALAVLKANRPNLLEDARVLFRVQPGTDYSTTQLERRCWDADFDSWPELAPQVRVVRSAETRSIRRQRTGQVEQVPADWLWVTTLARQRASTLAVVDMGHDRWSIENQGFNELVNRWHADHVYKHHPRAMLVFFLVALLCLNVFVVFYARNLKPAARQAMSMLYLARLIAAELLVGTPAGPSRAPT